MAPGIRTVIYPVSNLAQAKELFTALLGTAPYVDEPYYVGFRVADQEIGLDPGGQHRGLTGPIGYLEVDDIHRTFEQLLDNGAQLQQPVIDVGGGKLIARVKDGDGNIIAVTQSP